MKIRQMMFLALGLIVAVACRKEGCTDQTASNYDKKAKKNNGTCIYGDPNIGGSGGNGGGTGGGPGGTGGTGDGELPIRLSGTENNNITITDKTTNSNAADYYIDGNWNINAEVTIQSGVRILMKAGSRITVTTNGSINAVGTASNPIEIYGEQSVSGFWGYILIESNNPNNKFIYCNISGGGTGSSGDGMISIYKNAQLTMQHTTISKGSGNGLTLTHYDGKLPDFNNNSFGEIEQYPIKIRSLHQADYLNNSNSFNNSVVKRRIYVGNSGFTPNTTVRNIGIPYYIANGTTIKEGLTTVEAGVELVMGPNIGISVDPNGSLSMLGNSGSDKVIVRGDQPAKGFWKYIFFESNNPNNKLSNVDISDGSSGNSGNGMVFIYKNSSLTMDNCHISNGTKIALNKSASGVFNDNGGNTWSNCDEGGGLLP